MKKELVLILARYDGKILVVFELIKKC